MKIEETAYSETSAYKIKTPENYQEESMQHSEHGESLKSRKILFLDPAPGMKNSLQAYVKQLRGSGLGIVRQLDVNEDWSETKNPSP